MASGGEERKRVTKRSLQSSNSRLEPRASRRGALARDQDMAGERLRVWRAERMS